MNELNLPITMALVPMLRDCLETTKKAAQTSRLYLLEEGIYDEAAEALELYVDAERALNALPPVTAKNEEE